MTPMAHTLRRLLPLFLLPAAVALTACTTRTIDLPKALEITDVETGYFDAGIVDGKNKIVPTIAFRLKNRDSQPVASVQMLARFGQVDDSQELGSGPYVRAIGPEGLAPGQTGDPVVMKIDVGYTSEAPRAQMFTHSHVQRRAREALREIRGAGLGADGRVPHRATTAHAVVPTGSTIIPSMVAPNRDERAIGLSTATAVVAANMIGTGVFTSLGFQLLSLETGFAILALWLVGGRGRAVRRAVLRRAERRDAPFGG